MISMGKTRKCPMCDGIAKVVIQTYKSCFKKSDGSNITVDGVEVYECPGCEFSWLPSDQEKRIDQIVAKESGNDLVPMKPKP